MSDEKRSSDQPVDEAGADYKAPAIEEVVTRETLEREVAYAGVIGGSNNPN